MAKDNKYNFGLIFIFSIIVEIFKSLNFIHLLLSIIRDIIEEEMFLKGV